MSERGTFDVVMTAIDIAVFRQRVAAAHCGGYASFEGWVRNHNEGEQVARLEYEIHAPLARAEGSRIIAEAHARFAIGRALAVHRGGLLEIGECAVWVGVSAPHRDAAFAACRYIIDETKQRLPIWKKEHYTAGNSAWINCATRGDHAEATAPDSL